MKQTGENLISRFGVLEIKQTRIIYINLEGNQFPYWVES